MKKVMRIVIPLAVLSGAAIGFCAIKASNSRPKDAIRFSGTIEVTDAQLSFKIPGTLEERLVDEGDAVKAGQVVARLDAADQQILAARAQSEVQLSEAVLAELLAGARTQEIKEAAAAVEQARAGLAELEAGSRPEEIAAALDDVQAVEAEARRLESDRRRFEALHDKRAVSAQQLEGATTAARVAKERLDSARERLKLAREGPRKETIEQARAALRRAEERYGLVAEGPRQEQIEQARARLASVNESLRLARRQLAYAELKAPFDGVVLTKAAEEGEYLNPGSPVLTVGDLERPWLRAFINETDLGRLTLGSSVEVTTDSYPGNVFKGVVTFISSKAEFTPKWVETHEQRVKLMYRIKVQLDNPDWQLKPGMPADGIIRLGANPHGAS